MTLSDVMQLVALIVLGKIQHILQTDINRHTYISLSLSIAVCTYRYSFHTVCIGYYHIYVSFGLIYIHVFYWVTMVYGCLSLTDMSLTCK